MPILQDFYPDSLLQYDSNIQLDVSNAVDLIELLSTLESKVDRNYNGFIGELPDFILGGTLLPILVKYQFSELPKIDIIDLNNNIKSTNSGTPFNDSIMFKFNILIDDEWQKNSSYVVKLYSDDSPMTFTYMFRLITDADSPSTKSDIDRLLSNTTDQVILPNTATITM